MEEVITPIKKAKLIENMNCTEQVLQSDKTRTCRHWVKRKKRYCRMIPVKENNYCGEHQPTVIETSTVDLNAVGNNRIPCPLDSKHTIYQKNLHKHLRICNARQLEGNQPDYIVKNINVDAGRDVETNNLEELNNVRLNDLADEEFYGIIQKVNNLYEKYAAAAIDNVNQINIDTCNNYNSYVAADMQPNEEIGTERFKHLKQVSTLLDILEHEQLFKKAINFIEFGAGKGQLSYYLAKALEAQVNAQVILIDRKSLRHKKDNKIEDRSRIQRIRADIADLKMDKLPISLQPCVAVSKHLCGGATDLTLRCITQCKTHQTDLILIALCCHHRCDWNSYVGKEFFQQNQLSRRDFIIITKMVSWAVCGTGLSREHRKAFEKNQRAIDAIDSSNQLTVSADVDDLTNQCDRPIQDNLNNNHDLLNSDKSINQKLEIQQRLSLAEREIIGYKCKRLLDYARLKFLQCHGYEATLKQYVPKSVTLENIVLLAKRKK